MEPGLGMKVFEPEYLLKRDFAISSIVTLLRGSSDSEMDLLLGISTRVLFRTTFISFLEDPLFGLPPPDK
jgi:hypothetical protein